MPNPINFSVAAAQRSGSFQTSTLTYPGGFSTIEWQLVGMGTGAGSDYENPANKFAATVQFSTDNGTTFNIFDNSTWVGGPQTFKGVVDPPPNLAIGLANLPAGCQVFVKIDLTGTFTIGISGTIS